MPPKEKEMICIDEYYSLEEKYWDLDLENNRLKSRVKLLENIIINNEILKYEELKGEQNEITQY